MNNKQRKTSDTVRRFRNSWLTFHRLHLALLTSLFVLLTSSFARAAIWYVDKDNPIARPRVIGHAEAIGDNPWYDSRMEV